MAVKIRRHLKGYIIPAIILLVTITADFVFSPDSGILKGLVSDRVTIHIDGTKEVIPMEEEESDTLFTLPQEGRSLLSPWIAALRDGEHDKAYTVLDSIELTEAQKQKYQGITLYYKGQYPDADSLLALSVKRAPQDGESWYNRGRIAFRRDRLQVAQGHFEKALEVDSLLSGAFFYLGRIALKREEHESARRELNRALEVGYRKDECWYYLGLSYAPHEVDPASFAFREVVRYNPKSIKGRLRLAAIDVKRGETKEAQELYEQVLSIDKKQFTARLELLHLLLSAKEYHRASQHLAVLKQQNPNSVEVLYEEAKLLGLQGRDKAALKIYNKIAHLDAKNPRVFYNMGVNLMDLGQKKKAVKAYKRALAMNEYYWQAAYNLGVHYLKSGKLKSARTYLRRSNQVQPEHVGSLYNLGLVKFKKGDYSGANLYFKNALHINRRHYASRYNLALSLIKMDEYDAALDELNRLLEMKPNDEKLLSQKGLIALKQNRLKDAELLFTQVVQIDSTAEAARYNLMLVHERSGSYSKALRTVDDILDLRPRNVKALLKKGNILVASGASKREIKRVTGILSTLSLSYSEKLEFVELLEKSDQFKRGTSVMVSVVKKNRSISNQRIYARLLVKSGSGKKGGALFRKLYDKGSLNDEGLLDYAEALVTLKKPVRATNIIRELVEKNPKSESYRKVLAELYMEREKYGSAAKSYRRLYRLTKKVSYKKSQAMAMFKADSFKVAGTLYREVLTEKKSDWDALYFSALIAVRQGESEKALTGWDSFLAAYPKDSRGYFQKGKVYYSMGKHVEAKELLQKGSVALEHPHAHYYLADIFVAEGKHKEARIHLDSYLTKYPTSKRGIALKNRLQG